MRPSSLLILFAVLLSWWSTGAAEAAKVGPGVHQQVASGSARVLVLLNDPTDLRSDKSSQISAIKSLRDSVIDALDEQHLTVRREFVLLPAFAAEIDAAALTALAAHPGVRRIDLDSGGSGAMLDARPLARIDELANAGLNGSGQTIAIIDTGIAISHLDFSERVVAQQCFCSSSSGSGGCCPNGAATQSGPGSAVDDNGHGSNVAGIAAGGGAIAPPGVAPAATATTDSAARPTCWPHLIGCASTIRRRRF